MKRNIHLLFKRLIDLFGSLIGIVILLPLFILIALLVKLTSKGPVFFKQERLGKNGQVFKIVKFRTMVVNAENMGTGLSIKGEKDNRITGIGRILRKSSLDELSQLFNVLLGQMSLVGPRPPVTYYPYPGYKNYPKWTKKRFQMRPGITGLSQSTMRNSVSWNIKIAEDIKYVKEFNIWLDIKILFKTFFTVFKSKNIYRETNESTKPNNE